MYKIYIKTVFKSIGDIVYRLPHTKRGGKSASLRLVYSNKII